MTWYQAIKDLRKAMYNWNMVFGRPNHYTYEYKCKVDKELQEAAKKVASFATMDDE